MDESTGETGGGSGGRSGRRSKIERVVDERDLDGLGHKLERRWSGEAENQYSLRELADYFNASVLRSAMERGDEDLLEGEAENLYELLMRDDVTDGTQIQAERRLERAGIDVDGLKSDFVSHQAVHSYLTKHRGVERPSTESEDRSRRSLDAVQQLRYRLKAVTERAISTLRGVNELTLGDFDIRVTCNDCRSQSSIVELVENGGCDCE